MSTPAKTTPQLQTPAGSEVLDFRLIVTFGCGPVPVLGHFDVSLLNVIVFVCCTIKRPSLNFRTTNIMMDYDVPDDQHPQLISAKIKLRKWRFFVSIFKESAVILR